MKILGYTDGHTFSGVGSPLVRTVTSQRDLLNVRRPSLGGTLGTESKVEGHILTLFTDTGLIFHNDALDTGNTWLCESPEQLVLS